MLTLKQLSNSSRYTTENIRCERPCDCSEVSSLLRLLPNAVNSEAPHTVTLRIDEVLVGGPTRSKRNLYGLAAGVRGGLLPQTVVGATDKDVDDAA